MRTKEQIRQQLQIDGKVFLTAEESAMYTHKNLLRTRNNKHAETAALISALNESLRILQGLKPMLQSSDESPSVYEYAESSIVEAIGTLAQSVIPHVANATP